MHTCGIAGCGVEVGRVRSEEYNTRRLGTGRDLLSDTFRAGGPVRTDREGLAYVLHGPGRGRAILLTILSELRVHGECGSIHSTIAGGKPHKIRKIHR